MTPGTVRVLQAPASPDPAIAERDFRALVADLARVLGWLVYWTWRSDHSPAGFPDLVLVKPGGWEPGDARGRVVLAELKAERGRLSTAQREWASALLTCPGVDYFVWKPTSWPEILRVLTKEA